MAGRGCGDEATGASEGQRVSDGAEEERKTTAADLVCVGRVGGELVRDSSRTRTESRQIGRASCRERVSFVV